MLGVEDFVSSVDLILNITQKINKLQIIQIEKFQIRILLCHMAYRML